MSRGSVVRGPGTVGTVWVQTGLRTRGVTHTSRTDGITCQYTDCKQHTIITPLSDKIGSSDYGINKEGWKISIRLLSRNMSFSKCKQYLSHLLLELFGIISYFVEMFMKIFTDCKTVQNIKCILYY